MIRSHNCKNSITSEILNTNLRIQSGFYFLLFICVISLTSLNSHAQIQTTNSESGKPLKVGLIPILSTQLLLKKFNPLLTYLQQELDRPIIPVTAPNFKTYFQRVKNGDFDLYLTAPHMAAYHEKHNKHKRLAKFTQKIEGAIIVAKDSPYQKITDLKTKTIAAPDILAVVTSLGELTLIKGGIDPSKDIQILYTPSHNNALFSVAEKKADAAVLGHNIYKIIQSRSKIKKPLRVLATTELIPHMMFMSPSQVPGEQQEKFKDVLLNFTANGAGKEFFSGIPFIDMGTITDEDMSGLQQLLHILEKNLDK